MGSPGDVRLSIRCAQTAIKAGRPSSMARSKYGRQSRLRPKFANASQPDLSGVKCGRGPCLRLRGLPDMKGKFFSIF